LIGAQAERGRKGGGEPNRAEKREDPKKEKGDRAGPVHCKKRVGEKKRYNLSKKRKKRTPMSDSCLGRKKKKRRKRRARSICPAARKKMRVGKRRKKRENRGKMDALRQHESSWEREGAVLLCLRKKRKRRQGKKGTGTF